MIGVDTNIIVRLLTRDHEAQFQAARALFQAEQIFISKSVILEVEWVLRFVYAFAPSELIDALQGLFGLENVEVEKPLQVETALAWHARGLDFAGALHLVASEHVDRFVTFDGRLLAGAGKLSPVSVESP